MRSSAGAVSLPALRGLRVTNGAVISGVPGEWQGLRRLRSQTREASSSQEEREGGAVPLFLVTPFSKEGHFPAGFWYWRRV